jgi:hypothetical protein
VCHRAATARLAHHQSRPRERKTVSIASHASRMSDRYATALRGIEDPFRALDVPRDAAIPDGARHHKVHPAPQQRTRRVLCSVYTIYLVGMDCVHQT